MWSIIKASGRPLHPNLGEFWEWPHTITTIVALRMRYDSYQELTEPPPQEHWDHPDIIRSHIEKLYPSAKKGSTSVEIDMSDVEW